MQKAPVTSRSSTKPSQTAPKPSLTAPKPSIKPLPKPSQAHSKVFSTLKPSLVPPGTSSKPRATKQAQTRKDVPSKQTDPKKPKSCSGQPSQGASEMNDKKTDKNSSRKVAANQAKAEDNPEAALEAQSENVEGENDQIGKPEQPSPPLPAPVPPPPADSPHNQVCTGCTDATCM